MIMEMEPAVILEASNITKSFVIDKQRVQILREVSLQVYSGEIVAIVGKSGSGKSTLLNVLSGLDVPDEGGVLISGRDMSSMKRNARAKWRLQHVGFVFQNYNLQNYLTLEQNIMIPSIFSGEQQDSMRVRCADLIAQLGLEGRKAQYASKLSGGEAQRVGIARALMNSPRIIFADEPTGNLDPANAQSVLDAFLETSRLNGAAVVVVTHDEKVAAFAHRIVRLEGGQLV